MVKNVAKKSVAKAVNATKAANKNKKSTKIVKTISTASTIKKLYKKETRGIPDLMIRFTIGSLLDAEAAERKLTATSKECGLNTVYASQCRRFFRCAMDTESVQELLALYKKAERRPVWSIINEVSKCLCHDEFMEGMREVIDDNYDTRQTTAAVVMRCMDARATAEDFQGTLLAHLGDLCYIFDTLDNHVGKDTAKDMGLGFAKDATCFTATVLSQYVG